MKKPVYEGVRKHKGLVITNIYSGKISGFPHVDTLAFRFTMCYPIIIYKDSAVGIIQVDLAQSYPVQELDSLQRAADVPILLISDLWQYIFNPDSAQTGVFIQDTIRYPQDLMDSVFDGHKVYDVVELPEGKFHRMLLPISVTLADVPWIVESFIRVGHFREVLWQHSSVLLLVILGGGVVFVLLSAVVARRLTRPLDWASQRMMTMASGDLSAGTLPKLPTVEYKILAQGMEEMREKLLSIFQDISTQSENMLTQSAAFQHSAEQIADSSQLQSQSSDSVTETIDDLSSLLMQAQEDVSGMSQAADHTLAGLERVVNTASESVLLMQDIHERLEQIQRIARHINILALNAAVEAARAGATGRGFAVVAAEIRRLAEDSQKVAVTISEAINKGVEGAERNSKQAGELLPTMQHSAALSQASAKAAIEQANRIAIIAQSIEKLASSIRDNAAASNEVASRAQILRFQAEDLRKIIAYFNA